MDKNTIILLCVSVYMLLCIAIGLWAMRRTKSTTDFFMASRNLGVLVTGVALFSSIMSGFGFVGGPGLVYRMGSSSFWILVASPLGFALAFFLLAKRIRLLAELTDAISLPDVAGARYDSRAVRLMVAVAVLSGVVAYLGVQIKAMAVVMQQIAVNNGLPGAESLLLCVVVSCAVLVFYCVTGGIIASVYTDLFQGLVMMAVALAVFTAAVMQFDGGLAGMSQVIARDNAESAGPWGTLGMFGCLSWFFLFTAGVIGQPHIVTKLMMSRRVEDARASLPITLLGYAVTALLWLSIGWLMRALVLSGEHPALAAADDAAAEFLYSYATPIVAGLAFAGLFAAIMSTADGFLNIGAAAIVHDIPCAIRGKSVKNELLWARVATVLLAIGAATFALLSPIKLIGQLGAFGWGVFAAALVPAIGIGLSWKQATPMAATCSIAVSLVINLLVVILQLSGYAIPYGIAGGAIALIASLMVFMTISLFSRAPAIKSSVRAVIEI